MFFPRNLLPINIQYLLLEELPAAVLVKKKQKLQATWLFIETFSYLLSIAE